MTFARTGQNVVPVFWGVPVDKKGRNLNRLCFDFERDGEITGKKDGSGPIQRFPVTPDYLLALNKVSDGFTEKFGFKGLIGLL